MNRYIFISSLLLLVLFSCDFFKKNETLNNNESNEDQNLEKVVEKSEDKPELNKNERLQADQPLKPKEPKSIELSNPKPEAKSIQNANKSRRKTTRNSISEKSTRTKTKTRD